MIWNNIVFLLPIFYQRNTRFNSLSIAICLKKLVATNVENNNRTKTQQKHLSRINIDTQNDRLEKVSPF